MDSVWSHSCSVQLVYSLFVQVEIIKKAYNQESEDSEEDEVSPREVGHNIYILAQQVTQELLVKCWNSVVSCHWPILF